MNLSVSPNTGMLYNQRDLYSGNYTYAAEDLPAGTYMVTISLWGTVSSATPIYVTIVCTGDELPSPPEMDPPAPTPSYYPDAITLGSANRNHIVTRTYTATNGNAWQDAVGYYDGLGRPEQTVRVKAGGGTGQKDWVSLTLYDAHGREEKSYLPAALGSSNNGAYVNPSSLKTQAQTSNGSDSKPYSLNVYEASPLNRVVTQYGPGNAW
ncbi:MAG: DUF6443 domain-containing protein, partial [Prevotellaceae bacterium]|nr:DUF6443 domain-containing protein [Prevotellaceae bacterium]